MCNHGRCAGLTVGLIAAAIATSSFVRVVHAQPAPAPQQAAADDMPPQWRAMQEDAELAGVCFADERRGWAVGDRGVIWHTADGGRSWQLQSTGVRAPLSGIQMLASGQGFAVGGHSQEYTHATAAVLLRSLDAGETWQPDNSVMLPALRGVQFFDHARGWTFGEPSAMYPTGAFYTDNGGRSWTHAAGDTVRGWLACDFADPATGILAGRRGAVATVRGRKIESSTVSEIGLRGVKRLKLLKSGDAWLVGDAGLVLVSRDQGTSWQTPEGLGSTEAFNWRALAVRGKQIWIAGSPGSRILHSFDAGTTWESFATGQPLPINDLTFIDDTHGWAVGALGAIVATRDGGRTWQRQRAGGSRVAILALLGESDAAPLELFARLSANEGYLTAVEFVARRDLDDPRPALETLGDRAAVALSSVGVSATETASNFPLRQAALEQSAEQIVEAWDRANDGHAIDKLEEHFVRQLRIWRPEIVVTHAASPRGHDTLGHLINQIVVRAVDRAADANAYPAQIADQQLQPWSAKKVLGMLADGQPGRLNITTTQLAPRWGCTLADLGDQARASLADHYLPPPATIGFQVAIDALPQSGGSHDFTSGVVLYPGSDARRLLGESPDLGADLMRRVAQKHRNVQAILAHTERTRDGRDALIAQIADLTFGLEDAAAGEVLFEMAHLDWQAGRWEQAAETFGALIVRYPRHRLASASLVWLLCYTTSGEVALHRGQGIAAARYERAAAIARQIEQQFPTFYAEPPTQLPWLAQWRDHGPPGEAARLSTTTAHTRPRDAWWSCFAGEAWLADTTKGSPPKPIWRVKRCERRPNLDGHLDDDAWQLAEPIELRSALGDDRAWPAEVMATYDAQYLYLAVRCRQAEASDVAPSTGTRVRDPNLSNHERVELLIDVDRDHASWYRLVIDHRGWVAEDCWGDASWNPAWYVAADRQPGAWTVEAAMPLEALITGSVERGMAWAVGAQRVVPKVGFQSWTTPAAIATMPEGFGYLMFE